MAKDLYNGTTDSDMFNGTKTQPLFKGYSQIPDPTDSIPLGNTFYQNSLDINDLPGFTAGTESMFNKYSVFSLNKISRESTEYQSVFHKDIKQLIDPKNITNVDPIMNNFQGDTDFAKIQRPTASIIIDNSKNNTNHLMGHLPYSWPDFLYCKYYGKVENNRLITLRRYPIPIVDSALGPDSSVLVPVAQALTFFGDDTDNKLSEVMKFSYGLNWSEIQSEAKKVDGNEKGFGNGIEGPLLGNKNVAQAGSVMNLYNGDPGRWDGSHKVEQEWLKGAWEDGGAYWNQVYGPINVVDKTYKRERGMKFKQDISLSFTYSLNSINGINPKVAMLDIISNFLLLTYNNAKFWGGMTRYFPNYQDTVGFLGNQNAFYSGQWGNYFESVKSELIGLGSKIMGGIKDVMNGDFSAIEKLAANAGAAAMGKLAQQSRPHILSIRNLLTGAPIGEWHIVVGNPLDPIAVMGNMIVEDVDVKFSDVLGADDFPSDITFTVKLKHGRPRDLGDIESMFNLGMGRMSYTPVTKLPSEQNTHGDASNKQAGKEYNKRKDFEQSVKTMDTKSLVDKYLTTGDSKKTYQRISGRLNADWGTDFGGSKHLVFLLSKTKCKF